MLHGVQVAELQFRGVIAASTSQASSTTSSPSCTPLQHHPSSVSPRHIAPGQAAQGDTSNNSKSDQATPGQAAADEAASAALAAQCQDMKLQLAKATQEVKQKEGQLQGLQVSATCVHLPQVREKVHVQRLSHQGASLCKSNAVCIATPQHQGQILLAVAWSEADRA